MTDDLRRKLSHATFDQITAAADRATAEAGAGEALTALMSIAVCLARDHDISPQLLVQTFAWSARLAGLEPVPDDEPAPLMQ